MEALIKDYFKTKKENPQLFLSANYNVSLLTQIEKLVTYFKYEIQKLDVPITSLNNKKVLGKVIPFIDEFFLPDKLYYEDEIVVLRPINKENNLLIAEETSYALTHFDDILSIHRNFEENHLIILKPFYVRHFFELFSRKQVIGLTMEVKVEEVL